MPRCLRDAPKVFSTARKRKTFLAPRYSIHRTLKCQKLPLIAGACLLIGCIEVMLSCLIRCI
ncbi:hypothetical protein KP509_1Z237700 [Ceratopteris richardii]|nr:hypothetical protein KP509_1Z237700 [Ceratopteris richardii]